MSSQVAAVYKVVFIEPRSAVVYFPRKASGADLSAFLSDVLHARYFWYADIKSPSRVARLEDLETQGAWSWPSTILIGTKDNDAAAAERISNTAAAAETQGKPAHVIRLSEREQALRIFESWACDHPAWAGKAEDDLGMKSLVSNCSVAAHRTVQFGEQNDVREFSKRASAQAVSAPTKYMLRVKRANALQRLALRYPRKQDDDKDETMAADSRQAILFRVRNPDKPGREFVQLNCRNKHHFAFVTSLKTKLPKIADADVDAIAVVFDVSDLENVPPVLTTSAWTLLDNQGLWPGQFTLADLAYSKKKRAYVLKPEWLLHQVSAKPDDWQFWYDAIQGLTGDEYVHIQEMIFLLIRRKIAKIARLEKVVAGDALENVQNLQKELVRLQPQHGKESSVEDDIYF